MAVRNVRENGDEILRKKSRKVEVVDDKIRELLDDMVDTMHHYNGVGLSAVQVGILKRLVRFFYSRADVSNKKKYFRNRMIKVTLNITSVILVVLLWGHRISGMVTVISFLSAGIAIAVKEIIFDFFAGIYINTKKTFELEDRIEVNGIKGDVVNIRALGFEVLEVGDRINGEQSTGRIIHIPNSFVFIFFSL